MANSSPFPNPLRDDEPSTRPARGAKPAADRPRDPTPVEVPPPNKSPAFPVRFSLGSLFAAMFLASIVAAGASYYVRFLRGSESAKFAFTLFTLASPVLLMILVSLVASFLPKQRRRRRAGDAPLPAATDKRERDARATKLRP